MWTGGSWSGAAFAGEGEGFGEGGEGGEQLGRRGRQGLTLGGAEVAGLALLREQEEVVEPVEERGRGLVHHEHHGAPLVVG